MVFQLFHCYMFLALQLVFWLLHGYLSKSNFDIFQVAFKGNRRLYWWNPVWFCMEWMFSMMVTVKYVLETHSSRKLFEIGQQMAFDFIYMSHGCRDKLKPFWQYAYLAVSQSVIWEIFKKFLLCLPFFVAFVFVWWFFFALCACHFLTVLQLILYLQFLWLFVQRSHCCSFQYFSCFLSSVYIASLFLYHHCWHYLLCLPRVIVTHFERKQTTCFSVWQISPSLTFSGDSRVRVDGSATGLPQIVFRHNVL